MDTETIRNTLRNEESRLENIRKDLRSADELDPELRDESTPDLSPVDNHPADIATDQQQREVDLSLLEQIEAELNDVEHAMTRLDEGTYGKCERCGEAIAEERLEAQPAARFCTLHAG